MKNFIEVRYGNDVCLINIDNIGCIYPQDDNMTVILVNQTELRVFESYDSVASKIVEAQSPLTQR